MPHRTTLPLAALLLGLAAGHARAANPNVLWEIAHDRCVPDAKLNNDPKPCAAVDLREGEARGHVLLKDIVGATQFLLIPTSRVGGIESPAVLAPDAPNYFAAAWAARGEVDAAAHRKLPRQDIGLAINSAYGRTQNEFHIHIDCLRPEVIEALRSRDAGITEQWARLPVKLAGHDYMVRRLGGAALGTANPFRLLADGLPAAAADMADETLVVAGAVFADGTPGFYLLAGRADLAAGNRGSGEELQDHSCAVAR
ncbi:MAG TPA: CDP-diacylglycerol diphosphatase [Acetobacteraceae bacterium]|nr:CDP-diacylglycerol diphosphatase [Acetobacteraceae bacterium]